MLESWMRSYITLALFLLRLTIGVVFMAHGGQKLFGMFGGPGLEGTIEMFSNLNIPFSSMTAWFVSCIEFFGGIGLIIGIVVREISLLLIFVMIGAIWTVHGPNGFFLQNQGYEYNFVLIGACLALFFAGGGPASLDQLIFPKPKWTFVKDPSKIKLEPPIE